MTNGKIDFDRLLKLRLVVARVGEMDLAKWWNTRGQLGRLGSCGGPPGISTNPLFCAGAVRIRGRRLSLSRSFRSAAKRHPLATP